MSLLTPQSSPISTNWFAGALSNSSVEKHPKTQPFNNTSVILGATWKELKFMFTADAGSEALDCLPAYWQHLAWMQVPHHGSDGNLSQQNIERFCPQNAYISAGGDSSHPSRAIVSGLVKVGTQVFSTHQTGHLWHSRGSVPARLGYHTVQPLKGTGSPEPVDWPAILAAVGGRKR